MREYTEKGGFLISKDGAEEQLPPHWIADLSYDEAKKIMDSAEYRLVEYVEGPPWWTNETKLNKPEIYVNGKWLSLCRTDWKDNVATSSCGFKSLDEWKENYTLRDQDEWTGGVSARMTDGYFAVIDSFSDG